MARSYPPVASSTIICKGNLPSCSMSCRCPSGSFVHDCVPSGVATSSWSFETSMPTKTAFMRDPFLVDAGLSGQWPRRLFGLSLNRLVGIWLFYGLWAQGVSITRPATLLRFVRYAHYAEQPESPVLSVPQSP